MVTRAVDNRGILDKFAEEFCEIINKHAKYIVCSGFVAIAHGRSRGTEDIDMIIEPIPKDKFLALHQELVSDLFVCVQSDNPLLLYDEYLKKGVSIRYVYKSDGFFPPEMEVKFAKDELDFKQLRTRVKFPLTHLNIYFSTIEHNIAFKEEWLRSEKDLEDAKHLRIIYEGKIDESMIDNIKEAIKRRIKNEKRRNNNQD